MKASQFLILTFLIISNSLFCQSEYIPLIDTTKQWNILRSDWDYERGLPEYHWLYSQKTIGERFRDDTIINNKQYYFLERCYSDSLFNIWTRTLYLFREDTIERKVYLNWVIPENQEDFLLYDFSLEKEDSITFHWDYRVDSVQYKLFGNAIRKFIYLSNHDDSEFIVEGIGSFKELMAPYSWGALGDVSFDLQCYYEDSALLYQDERINECFTDKKYTGIRTEDIIPQIVIYPNPATNQFTIHTPNTHQKAYMRMYSLDGRLIVSKNLNIEKESISVRNIPNGIYFVSIFLHKSYTINKKIIIYH